MATAKEAESTLELLFAETASSGALPTVTSFARILEMKRPTVYAAFIDLVARIVEERPRRGIGPRGRSVDGRVEKLRNQLAAVRHASVADAYLLATYAEQIGILTVENQELRTELESSARVRSLLPRGQQPPDDAGSM